MTTIAYNHKDRQIAYDSRLTSCGMVMSDTKSKMVARNGLTFFISGSDGGVSDFIDMHTGCGKADNHPEVSAFMVDEKGNVWLCVVTEDMIAQKSIVEYNSSMGSGEQFALAAMDMGKTASDAVKYAKTRCIYTGGKVNVYDIERKEVI